LTLVWCTQDQEVLDRRAFRNSGGARAAVVWGVSPPGILRLISGLQKGPFLRACPNQSHSPTDPPAAVVRPKET